MLQDIYLTCFFLKFFTVVSAAYSISNANNISVFYSESHSVDSNFVSTTFCKCKVTNNHKHTPHNSICVFNQSFYKIFLQKKTAHKAKASKQQKLKYLQIVNL